MKSDVQEVKRSLGVLFEPGETIELRCVGNRTISGFYRDQDKLAADAQQLNSVFKPLENCYVTLNPVQPELFGRRADEFAICKRGEAVRDADVACRRWLLIDVDSVRPAGVSATDSQKQAAIDLAKQVYAWLQDQLGPACILCCDSGNGAHMLVRLPDLPADELTRWVCEHFLQMLAERFSSEQAKVDRSTFNSARICTLYGTAKRKGSSIPEQPHRMSRLVHVPDPLQPVDWQRLAALVEPYPGNQQTAQQPAVDTFAGNGQLAIDQLLQQHGVEYSRDDSYRTQSGEQATRWQPDVCPFNPEHNDRSAVILQWQSGATCFRCHHDSCTGRDWPALRQLWQLPSVADELQAAVLVSLNTQPQTTAGSQPVLAITAASTVEPQEVDWLWPGKIALGKLTIIAGYGGCGKTFLICDLAARISSGRPAPDGQQFRQGRVLIATGEDGLADTLVPRLIAHEADLSRIDFIEGVQQADGLHLLDLLQHIAMLRAALVERPDTAMLLVDPISSFMGAVDTHKTSDVRRVLSAVAKLAEDHAIAFVGIHHLRKAAGPAIHAITGSQAFSDAVRTVWLVGLDRDNAKRRLMLPSKNNLAEMHGSGLAYTIELGRVLWEPAPVLMAADDLLVEDSDPTPRDEAQAWLQHRRQAGPQAASEVIKAGKSDGIAEKTLRRAKKDLGVLSVQQERQWSWQLPDDSQVATSDAPNP